MNLRDSNELDMHNVHCTTIYKKYFIPVCQDVTVCPIVENFFYLNQSYPYDVEYASIPSENIVCSTIHYIIYKIKKRKNT